MPHDFSTVETVFVASVWAVILSAGTYAALYKLLGEKLFGHWLERRMAALKADYDIKFAGVNANHSVAIEGVKAQNNISIDAIKHAQNAEIESLRAEIAYINDRGKHSNQREYDALTTIWDSYVDLHYATQSAVVAFIQFPDLNNSNAGQVSDFLSSTDFSEKHQTFVKQSENKNSAYTRVVTVGYITKAQDAVRQFASASDKLGIFMPQELKSIFDEGSALCRAAIAEQSIKLDFKRGINNNSSTDFVNKSLGKLENVKNKVRDRLLKS